MAKIPVALLGATGLVGEQYCERLAAHPLFTLAVAPSSEMMRTQFSRVLDEVTNRCRLVFSALPTAVARAYEDQFAQRGLPLFSVAAYHRSFRDVPLLIPEINPGHLAVLALQRRVRGWKTGCVIAKPNCTLQSYLLPLFPLHLAFQIEKVIVTTLQATSGAGKGFALRDNVIPFIEGEEEKSAVEPLKILGAVTSNGIESAAGIAISVHCNRVPVPMGHVSCVSVGFKHPPTRQEILAAWREFTGAPQQLALFSAPKQPIVYLEDCDRPQPQLDCQRDRGMAVTVGRLRPCPVLNFRFTALTHNLLRGAAGGALLSAELALRQGWVPWL
ncbi:MAG: aspartate-semialdehyde dehydrogenase [Chlamydiota bacterium]